ncbi:EamA family transporter [Amycolatopsis taiwanensis]|uniref:EamA family transporter n=1 Tax=Amycolatopsis taiwanensis TaxID=342230 RepID=UPI0007C4524C|nr:EamA family transporter [Amycolatopsis taiwanensis]
MGERGAPLLILGSVLSIQFGQALGKDLFGAVGPCGVVALRLGIAAMLMLLVYRPTPPRRRSEWALILGFGTAISGMNVIYLALGHLPLGLAIALQLLGPITLAVLTSRRLLDLALALLAGFGVWLFHVPGSATTSVAGVLPALLSGAAMAAYLLLSKQAGARSAGGSPLALALCWAALLAVPLGIAESGPALLNPAIVGQGALVAVLSAVLPYSLELAALRRMSPRTVGILQSLEPAIAGLAGTLILHEVLNPWQWMALACVGVASAGTVTGGQRADRSVGDRRRGPSGTGGRI